MGRQTLQGCRRNCRIQAFESQDGEVLFAFMEDTAVPVMGNVEYTFGYEDVRGFSDGRSRASC